MYDRRLDAIVSAANHGSFTRAASELNISTPALVKQVSGFEAEYGIVVFERSHTGVELTPQGRMLVEDAQSIMRQSRDSLRRVRGLDTGETIRLGVSLMCPGRNTLEMWPKVHELVPDLRLEIVPVGDLYDERESVMTRLGDEVDVMQTSYSTARWGASCALFPLFSSTFMIDVPRTSDLAALSQVRFSDLEGRRVRFLRHGNDAMDELRGIMLDRGGIEVIDSDKFDFALFNDAEEKGDGVVTSGAWSGIHPAFVGVPLAEGYKAPCFLAYPARPSERVARFVAAMRRVCISPA